MELNLPELSEVLQHLKYLEKMMEQMAIKGDLSQTWYNVDECHALKGGCALNTFKANYNLQPKGGVPDAKVGGRKVWHRDTVVEWLNITDAQLPEYLDRCRKAVKA